MKRTCDINVAVLKSRSRKIRRHPVAEYDFRNYTFES